MLQKIRNKLESYNYLRYLDNWHKVPIISRMMCKMGRHDYEFISADSDGGLLECFYCERKRLSRRV